MYPCSAGSTYVYSAGGGIQPWCTKHAAAGISVRDSVFIQYCMCFLGYSYLISLVVLLDMCLYFEPKHVDSLFFSLLNEWLHWYKSSMGLLYVFMLRPADISECFIGCSTVHKTHQKAHTLFSKDSFLAGDLCHSEILIVVELTKTSSSCSRFIFFMAWCILFHWKVFFFCILYVAEGVLPQPKMQWHSMQYTVLHTFI